MQTCPGRTRRADSDSAVFFDDESSASNAGRVDCEIAIVSERGDRAAALITSYAQAQERRIKNVQVIQGSGHADADSRAGRCPVYSIYAPQHNNIVLVYEGLCSNSTRVRPTIIDSCKVTEYRVLIAERPSRIKVCANADKCVSASGRVA